MLSETDFSEDEGQRVTDEQHEFHSNFFDASVRELSARLGEPAFLGEPGHPPLQGLCSRMRRPHPLALALPVLVASTSLRAADLAWPPTWGQATEYPRQEQSDARDDFLQFSLGDTPVRLGISELPALRKTFGKGRVRTSSRAVEPGASDHWLCYTASEGAAKVRVWLGGTSGNRSASDDLVDYVAELLPNAATATPTCPSLPARFSPLAFDHGVRLGDPAAELQAAMSPHEQKGDAWIVSSAFSNHRWLVQRYWAVRVVEGRIVGVRAGEAVSR